MAGVTIGALEHGMAMACAKVDLWLSGERPYLVSERGFSPLWIVTLARNLRDAAGLCAAWHQGFHSAALLHSANVFHYWRPGCQRPAP